MSDLDLGALNAMPLADGATDFFIIGAWFVDGANEKDEEEAGAFANTGAA